MLYLITGATGYIGSLLAQRLIDEGEQVIALVRNEAKARAMLPKEAALVAADLTDGGTMAALDLSFDYLVHCAAVTASLEMRNHPVEVGQSLVNATQNVLELARRTKPRSMVYVSSMEVYGSLDCSDGHRAGEAEAGTGQVDILAARSCYPLGKRMAENICAAYAGEYGLPVKIARLAQTFGRGVLPGDNRVFAQFARAAVRGEDIVLHTEGRSVGNYCDIDDVLEGLLTILAKGKDGEAYNVVNEASTMSIRELAELAAEVLSEGRSRVVVDIPQDNRYGYAADTGLRLSGDKLRALGWQPERSIREMFLALGESLK